MDRDQVQALLREHLDGVHEELKGLFRGVEKALDAHLERTETAIAEAFAREIQTFEARLSRLEDRVADLERWALNVIPS